MYFKQNSPTNKSASDSSTINQFAPRPFKVESFPEQDLIQPAIQDAGLAQQKEQPKASNLPSKKQSYHFILPKIAIYPEGSEPPLPPRVQMKLSLGQYGNKDEPDVKSTTTEKGQHIDAFMQPMVQYVTNSPAKAGELDKSSNFGDITNSDTAPVLSSNSDEVPLSNISHTVEFDVDGDGELEEKHLYFIGEGAGATLIINKDPMPFKSFIKNNIFLKSNSALTLLIDNVTQIVRGGNITIQIGEYLKQCLQNIGLFLVNNYQIARPPSQIETCKFKTITANVPGGGTVSEKVTGELKIRPLSSDAGSDLRGSGVTNSGTPYMNALRSLAPYIRGHMLNSKVHGPGDQDWNLVPISAAFNSQMEKADGWETHLKKEILGRNLVVSYHIIPQKWGQYKVNNRNAEAIEAALPAEFYVAITRMKLKSGGNGSNADDWQEVNSPYNISRVWKHTSPKSSYYNETNDPIEIGTGYGKVSDNCQLEQNSTYPSRVKFAGTLTMFRESGKRERFDCPTTENLMGNRADGSEVAIQILPSGSEYRLLVLSSDQASADLHLGIHEITELTRNPSGTPNDLGGTAYQRVEALKALLEDWMLKDEDVKKKLEDIKLEAEKLFAFDIHGSVGASTLTNIDENVMPKFNTFTLSLQRTKTFLFSNQIGMIPDILNKIRSSVASIEETANDIKAGKINLVDTALAKQRLTMLKDLKENYKAFSSLMEQKEILLWNAPRNTSGRNSECFYLHQYLLQQIKSIQETISREKSERTPKERPLVEKPSSKTTSSHSQNFTLDEEFMRQVRETLNSNLPAPINFSKPEPEKFISAQQVKQFVEQLAEEVPRKTDKERFKDYMSKFYELADKRKRNWQEVKQAAERQAIKARVSQDTINGIKQEIWPSENVQSSTNNQKKRPRPEESS